LRRRSILQAVATPVDDDDDEIITVLDSMIVGLGLRNKVNSGIEDMRQQQLARERQVRFERQQARFVYVNEDGNAIMMAQNVNRGLGASSRDANYRENVWCLIGRRREKGYCAVAKCQHPEMELLCKCDTCKRHVHVICLMDNNLLTSEEGGPNHHYCSRLCKDS
jgi:hypothetical protein